MRKLLVLCMAGALLLSLSAAAQATAVKGNVEDLWGNGIAGEIVTVSGLCDTFVVGGLDTTDAAGDYFIGLANPCVAGVDTCDLTIICGTDTATATVVCGDTATVDFIKGDCDPLAAGFFFPFEFADSLVTVVAGQTGDILSGFGPANVGGNDPDTLCVLVTSKGSVGGTYGPDPAWDCLVLGSGYFSPGALQGDIPCTAIPGQIDTVSLYQVLCRGGECQVNCVYDIIDVFVEVVPSPPALDVVCPDTAFACEGVNPINVPFDICNPDPCADTTCYNYTYVSAGTWGGAAAAGAGQVNVAPGDCERITVTLNGTIASAGDQATITMIAVDCDSTVFDTCTTVLEIVACPFDVPLFSTPVVALLILTLVLLAAGVLRRRAMVS